MKLGRIIVITFSPITLMIMWQDSVVLPTKNKLSFFQMMPIFDKIILLGNHKYERTCMLATLYEIVSKNARKIINHKVQTHEKLLFCWTHHLTWSTKTHKKILFDLSFYFCSTNFVTPQKILSTKTEGPNSERTKLRF